MRGGLSIFRFVPWLTLVAGCSIKLPDPLVERVEPPVGYVGGETIIQIIGENFLPAIDVDATGTQPDFESDFQVELSLPEGEGGPLSVALPGTVLRSYENLEAVVPAGLDPATYDVVVTGPTGASARLINGYTASSTQADHLAIEGDLLVYEVREEAQFRIELQDREGNRVFADEEVVVYVEAADGEASPSFTNGSLNDQIPVGNLAIQGSLGSDGAATIGLTSTTPDQLTVVVTPASTSSTLADGQTVVLFEPGGQISARLDLPEPSFEAVAGEPFPLDIVLVDQFGNEAPEATSSIVLRSACSAWVEVIDVIGRATISPTVTQATSPESSCEAERILSVAGASGETSAFSVIAGPAARFDVVASPDTITAGETPLQVVATPVDAFGNRAQWVGVPFIEDSMNGIGGFDCLVDQLIVCDASPRVAGADIRVTVDGQDGVVGTSDPYDVVPGQPTMMSIAVSTDPIVADDLAIVRLTVADAYQNTIDGSAFSTTAFRFFLDGNDQACTELVSPDSRIVFGCAVRQANPGVVFRAELTSFGLSSTAPAVPVVNGALASAVVTVDRSSLRAGEPLGVAIAAFDQWGNPYVVQADPVVQVDDSLGSFVPVPIALDAQGEVSFAVSPTLAGQTIIEVTQGAAALGASPTIVVEPGPPDALRLTIDAPWHWVGTPVPVHVQSIDTFGNQTDTAGIVTLTSATGSASDTTLALSGGVGEGALTWTAPQFDERIDASMTSLAGGAEGLLVVEACTTGPRADIVARTRVCGVDQEGQVEADLGGSTSGGSPLALVALSSSDGASSGEPGPLSVPLSGWGPHDILGLAVGQDGCAEEVAITTWLGPDDGSVVGPLTVTPSLGSLEAGSGQTTLDIEGALTCDNIPALGSVVRVRTDRGTIEGASPLGDGLYATVSITGSASAGVDAASAVEGPSLRVVASSPSGAARGEATIEVTGDIQPPTVVAASPTGETLGLVDTTILVMSEPIDPSTVAAAAFDIAGPSVARVQFATLLPDQRTIELSLQSAVDGSAGVWTITADPTITDLAGNGLDGTGDGIPSPHVLTFGNAPSEVSAVSCTVDHSAFRPDGDDGPEDQADAVTIALSTGLPPAEWVVSVYDASASLVRRSPADGQAMTVSWDGRDQSGQIVPDGEWTVEVDSRDAFGNLGGACSVQVTVWNEDVP